MNFIAQSMRRLCYSFLGLLTGFAVLILWLSLNVALAACLSHESIYSGLKDLLQNLPIWMVITLLGWVLLGVPFAIVVPSRILTRVHPAMLILGGALIGSVSLLLIFVIYANDHLHEVAFVSLTKTWLFFEFSAVVGMPAMYVYTLLLRNAAGRNVQQVASRN